MFFKNIFELFDSVEDVQITRHLHSDRWFAIKLPEKGEKIEELSNLKKTIVQLTTEDEYWKRTVKPASAILEHILQKQKIRRIIDTKEVFELNRKLDPKFCLYNSEIKRLLKQLHQAGTLLYFEETDLKDKIVLDVQWFVDAFKSILTYRVDIKEPNNDKAVTFKRTGELDHDQLSKIWNKRRYEEKHYETLTSFMERLGLLAVCHSENRIWYYFPSMNRRRFKNGHFEGFEKSSILSFQFDKEKQIPIFVFYKLVVKCIKLHSWKILTEKGCRCIYDDVACFSFQGHIVLLCIFNFQIQVQVCRRDEEIETNTVKEIKNMLENTMEKFRITNYKLGYKCRYGEFHEEGDNFFSESDFMEEKKLCEFCLNNKYHELGNGNGIYWAPPKQQRKDSVTGDNQSTNTNQEKTIETAKNDFKDAGRRKSSGESEVTGDNHSIDTDQEKTSGRRSRSSIFPKPQSMKKRFMKNPSLPEVLQRGNLYKPSEVVIRRGSVAKRVEDLQK